jgi:hypothetical protein
MKILLLILLGFSIVVLHLVTIAQPTLIVDSRLISRIVIPLLVFAMLVLPRKMKISQATWKRDPAYKWVSGVFLVSMALEGLLYAGLMFNLLAKFRPELIALDSNATFRMFESQVGYLIAFSILGAMLFPVILCGLRQEISGRQ